MRILFIADNFPPEVNAPANRIWAHCRRWAQAGEIVTVITTNPNFPTGRIFPGYRNRPYQRASIEGVDVIRVWSFIAPNEGFAARIIDFLSFALTSFVTGLFCRCDVIVTSSPQFFVGLSARALAFLKRKPWIFEVRDLWPESIAAVDMVRAGLIYRVLEALELHFYRSASKIIIVSEAFRVKLTSRGIPSEKIFTVPNGVELDEFKPRPADTSLRAELGMQHKFVVGFVGTHGLAHGLDFILSCAPDLKEEGVLFLFIGAGAKKAELVALAQKESLSNVRFLDPIARESVPIYLALCDAALVNLRRSETFLSVIPSKIFEAAALERPILLGVDGISRQIIEQYHAGIFYQPENREAFTAAVRRLKSDLALYSELQKGGRKLAHAYDRSAMAMQALEVIRLSVQRSCS